MDPCAGLHILAHGSIPLPYLPNLCAVLRPAPLASYYFPFLSFPLLSPCIGLSLDVIFCCCPLNRTTLFSFDEMYVHLHRVQLVGEKWWMGVDPPHVRCSWFRLLYVWRHTPPNRPWPCHHCHSIFRLLDKHTSWRRGNRRGRVFGTIRASSNRTRRNYHRYRIHIHTFSWNTRKAKDHSPGIIILETHSPEIQEKQSSIITEKTFPRNTGENKRIICLHHYYKNTFIHFPWLQ